MTPPKPKRRESRPRLDAILRHIQAGSFDDELNQLLGAIKDRNSKRQEAVLGLVHEVFGDGYTVRSTKAPEPEPKLWEPDQGNIFIEKSKQAPRSRPSNTPSTVPSDPDGSLPDEDVAVDPVNTGGGAIIGGLGGEAFGPGGIE